MQTRFPLPLLLAALLAGCATARDIAAAYQQAARRNEEQGIPVAASASTPAPSQDIPAGLVGDTRNARHAGPPVTPQ